MDELKSKLIELQDELSLAYDNADVVRANELEIEIDELQRTIQRIKSAQQ